MDSTMSATVRAEAERQAAYGNRQAALAVLEQLRGPSPDPATAILRAKILSQQGDFARAVDSWREALAADPESDEAKRGLALAEALRGSALGRFRLHIRRWGVALFAVVVVAVLVGATRSASRNVTSRELTEWLAPLERQRSEEARAAERRTEERLRQLQTAVDASQKQLQALLTEQTRAAAQLRDQLRRLDRRTENLANAIKQAARPATGSPDGTR
jgi:tetratricopeptide (TPR) repeat protein